MTISMPPHAHTFIVPAYQESPFLPACLASLRAQTVPSRIRVTTSTPCSHIAEAAAAVGADVVVNPQRRGIGSDWNFALATAAGSVGGEPLLVTLAHQDDVYAPQFLDRTLGLFASVPEATLAFTGAKQIDDAGSALTSRVSVVKEMLLGAIGGRRQAISGARGRWLLAFGNPISCSSVTFALDKLGSFRFDETWASNLDWDAWLRLIDRGDVLAFGAERLVFRRYNAHTATSRLILDGRRRAEDRAMFDRLWPKPIARALLHAYATGYSC